MHFSRPFRTLIPILAASLLAAGCSSKTARPTAPPRLQPAAVNVPKLAAKSFEQIKATTPLDEDPRTNAHIICVVDALVRDRGGDWEVAVLRNNWPAAFVLPGGKIGVNGSLVRVLRNQHQLAAVIAHGIAHTIARHPEKRIALALQSKPDLDLTSALGRPRSAEAALVFGLLGVPVEGGSASAFDPGQESEANVIGLELMARAGFNPKDSIMAWRNLEGNARAGATPYLAMHASYSDERRALLEARMPAALSLQAQYLASHKKPDCDRIR